MEGVEGGEPVFRLHCYGGGNMFNKRGGKKEKERNVLN